MYGIVPEEVFHFTACSPNGLEYESLLKNYSITVFGC